jgi:hypothetical protein
MASFRLNSGVLMRVSRFVLFLLQRPPARIHGHQKEQNHDQQEDRCLEELLSAQTEFRVMWRTSNVKADNS